MTGALAAKMFRTLKAASFSIFWFFITLLPVVNIVPIQNIFAARYLYLPAAGFCLLVAVIYELAAKRAGVVVSEFLKIILSGILMCYIFLIWQHNTRWNNEISFRGEFVKYYPRVSDAHRDLGGALYRGGFFPEARHELELARILNPSDMRILNDLSILDLKEGRLKEAAEKLKIVIHFDPRYDEEVYNTYCCLLGMQGKFVESKTCLQEVMTLFPRFSDAYLNLANVYEKGGNDDAARKILQEASGLFPEDRKFQERLKGLR